MHVLYCLVINVHLFCLSLIRDSFVIISCVAFFVNNFFQLFLILFSLFQRRLLKLISVFVDLLLPCSATLVNIHPSSTKVNNIFKNIAKKAKIITAIGIYYVANSVFSTVLSMFWLFGIDFIVDLSDSIPLNYSGPVFSLLMLTGILFLGMLCVACYSFQYWMLDRKLNLS